MLITRNMFTTIVAVVLLCSHATSVQVFTLAKGAKSECFILIPRNASKYIVRAGRELQHYIKRSCSVELPLREAPLLSVAIAIAPMSHRDVAVRRAWKVARRHRDISVEGFVIDVTERCACIVGGSEVGALFGACDFIERYLGVRWYLPGDLGEVVPRHDTVQIPIGQVREEPDFPMRYVGMGEWAWRNKTNRPTQSNPSGFRMWTSYPYHTFQHLVHPRDYFDDHPEWFPLVNGVRRKFNPAFGETRFAMTYGNQICTSNSEVVALIVTKLRNILSADASLRMVALAPNDNWGYCECENCKALDEPDATTDRLMSRRLVILYRAVARKLLQSHPKRRLLVGAYHIYTRPPKDASLRLPRNTWVIVCHYSPYCLAHPIAYRGKSRNTKSGRCMNEQFREIVETWKRISGGVVLYEYYAKDAWLSLPWAIVHSIRKDIPYLKHIGAGGLYTQWGMGTIWSNFLNYYIAAKLLWDASTDVDALLDEFYRKFYGNAAQQMKAYHETLERAFIEANICTPGSARDGVYIYTPDVLKRARMHIERALNVATDEVVRKRIEKQLASLNYAEMLIGYLRLVERGASVEERYVALSKLFRELEANPSRYRGVVAIGSVIRSRWYLARDMKRLRAHILLAAKAGRSQQLTTIPRVWKFKLDPNDVGVNEKWFLPDVSIADWRDIEIGKSWEAQGYDYDGFAWYRTMFTIPRKFSGKDVRLYFGGVDGKGWIYLNGKLIASHEGWDEPFEVRLRGHVKFGEWNVLVVRVYDGGGQGGIYGDVKCYAPQPLAHVIVGDEASERASAIRLRGFGKPEVRGGRICRNSDETGKGDNSAGWASFTFPLKERRYPVTLRMVVWGESDFSGVAVCTRGRGKGTAEGGVWTGIAPQERLKREPSWQELTFIIDPFVFDPELDHALIGFGGADSQIWLAEIWVE